MSITAAQLSKKNITSLQIKDLVKEHLDAIDLALQRHPRQIGKNTIRYEVPLLPEINKIERIDVEKMVMAYLITNLQHRGFEVTFTANDSIVMYIVFNIKMDENQKKAMDQLLLRCLRK